MKICARTKEKKIFEIFFSQKIEKIVTFVNESCKNNEWLKDGC